MAASARYTRFVALLKRSLWVLVAAMVGTLIWIATDNSGDKARIVFSNIEQSKELENIMAHPNYQGVDGRNRPFTVMADRAVQVDKDHVRLESIRADMGIDQSRWMAVNARRGELDVPNKQLELYENVNVFYEGGFEFRTDHAHVDIKQGAAYGDSRVEGQGPPGTLVADGFSIINKGQVIRFNGSVRMKLYRGR